MVTLDAHKAVIGGKFLGCISGCWVAPCTPSPFLLRAMICLPCLFMPLSALHASSHDCLHVHAWVLLTSVLSMLQHNEVMDRHPIQTYICPSRTPPLFVSLLFFLLACLLARIFARILVAMLAIFVFPVHFTSFSYYLYIFLPLFVC